MIKSITRTPPNLSDRSQNNQISVPAGFVYLRTIQNVIYVLPVQHNCDCDTTTTTYWFKNHTKVVDKQANMRLKCALTALSALSAVLSLVVPLRFRYRIK